MRAIVVSRFGGPEVLEYVELPTPTPKSGQVRIAVRAAAVNPVDTSIRRNGSWAGVDLPWTPGYDVAGVVDAVGPDVRDLHIGERVMALTDFPRGAGAYAEQVVVDSDALARLADHTSYLQAAAAPLAAGTAWEILRRLRMARGQRLLVLAASGGVGSYLVQLASLQGVRTVATASPQHHDRLSRLGAELCVDYRSAAANDQISADAEPISAIADLAGGEELMQWLDHLRPSAHIAAIASSTLDVDTIIDTNLTFHGVLINNDGARTRELAALLASRQLSSSIPKVLPLADAADAHRIVESRHAGGKVVLTTGSLRSVAA